MVLFIRRRRNVSYAVMVALRYITCPYCGSVLSAMTLGALVDKVHTDPVGRFGVANEKFRETHLANTVVCPVCGRRFKIFVGVAARYDIVKRSFVIDYIDVHLMKENDPYVDELSRWPHRGLVLRSVLEYTPGVITVYETLEDFVKSSEDAMELIENGSFTIAASTLPDEDSQPRDAILLAGSQNQRGEN